MAAPVRHLVVDNEAVAALLATTPQHPKRKEVILAVAAANGRTVVPTAVRCEAGWDRTRPQSAFANAQIRQDDPVDAAAADRNVQLRQAVPQASLVDASVVVTTERLPAGGVVEFLTSDPGDLTALAGHSSATVDINAI